MKIAIIGHGFVGSACEYGFNTGGNELIIVDPKYGTTVESMENTEIDFSFVCVPTPMREDHSIDSSIVESVVADLLVHTSGIIVIKSTVTPDVVERICTDRVIYNPEFLIESSAKEDFVNPKMHVIGTDDPFLGHDLEALYVDHSLCKPCAAYYMTPKEAAFVKYGINCFLASKVLWFNQFADIAEKNNVNFGRIINAIGTDGRIGHSHTRVPGFDGKRGYGGACFPKDTTAFAAFADGDFSVLDEVIARNNEYRSQYELGDREKEQNVSFS